MGKFIDLKGKKFDRWIVKKRVFLKKGKTHWLCECKCGNHSMVLSSHLIKGRSTKCKRCHNIEAASKKPNKHGCARRGFNDKTYQSWTSMKTRCLNSNSDHWKNYGDRKITFCPEWNNFSKFKKDMGERPNGTALDRIDNSKGYYLENCRWATHQQQCENKRSNIKLELNGIVKTKTEWSRVYQIPYTSFDRLIKKNGWPLPEPPVDK